MNLKTLGIDLAKNIFQLYGVDSNGKRVAEKRLNRDKLAAYVANLSPCIIGMEACGSAHYWARLFQSYGHTVKLIAPQFVKPFVRSNKNDRNDARAISEAMLRPEMKFVAIKTIAQQDMLLLHRVRELAIKNRTALANQIRGLLMEFGVILPKGISHIKKLPAVIEANHEKLSAKAVPVFNAIYEKFKTLSNEIAQYDKEIERDAKQHVVCKEIMKIPGIGPLVASALVATIGEAKAFKNGREVSAWLGIVPKQHSSGNKIRLGGISKRGDRYMRKMLIQGARAAINVCQHKTDRLSRWAHDKKERCGFNKAAVALANKNARMVWAIMATGECYRQPENVVA